MRDPRLIRELKDSQSWLKRNLLFHEDIVLERLPSPVLVMDGKSIISFCSNNYLGLNNDPRIIRVANEALLKYGGGTCESRKLGGNLFLLEELEERLAAFKHTEAAMIFATGLMANVGVIPAIVDNLHYMSIFYNQDKGSDPGLIATDKLNHRSIQMGIKLSRANVEKYDHSNMEQLSDILHKNKGRRILVVSDGLFSMDGDLADLPTIVKLAHEYDATVMIDDAHCTGVWGPTGRGSSEHFGIKNGVHVKMGTLSKAFGAMGGFIAAESSVIQMLKQSTSTYYFTSSLPAEQAAGLIMATKIIDEEGDQLRKKLWTNVYQVIKGFTDIGLQIPRRWTQIIPIIIGDERLCFDAERILLNEGILASSATVPAVAPGQARLRITVNACHTAEHINKLLESLKRMVKILQLPVEPYSGRDWDDLCSSIPFYMADLISLSKLRGESKPIA